MVVNRNVRLFAEPHDLGVTTLDACPLVLQLDSRLPRHPFENGQ